MRTIRGSGIRAVVAWLGLFGVILATDPFKIALPFLIVPFILLYFALYSTCMVLDAFSQRLHKNIRAMDENDAERPASWWPATVSLFVVVLALLGSIGQLTVRDVFSISMLFAVGWFYVSRVRRRST